MLTFTAELKVTHVQVQELDIDDDKTHEWLEKVKTLLSN